MQLKGAEIRDFYRLTADMPSGGTGIKLPKKVKIPHYQRPYKWDQENINKLIDDWFAEKGDQYFAGSIVTVNNERTGVHELIDGQQRFTTIFLANFVRFLVSRVALRQSVSETSKILHVTKVMDSYIESAKFLFLNYPEAGFSLEEELDELNVLVTSGFDDIDDEEKFSETREQLLRFIGLPDLSEDSDDYLSEHYRCLGEFLDRKRLALSYDRKSFDVAILNSLKRVCIYLNEHRRPEIEIYKPDEVVSEHEKRYLDAVSIIFGKFYQLGADKSPKPFECAKDIIANIGRFLQDISLCVVQTGNAEDAYTLFEVLNDRSLALDDLDLIKNQFYKNFVLKNESVSDNDLDSILQELDDQWVDKVFYNQGDQRGKLVAYLAIVYITGDSAILYNRGDGYRHAIQHYLEALSSYSEIEIRKHFNVFHACRIILDNAGVKFRSKDLVALESEFSGKDSVLKKTICLLMALGQEGVLSGLINFVLRYMDSSSGGQSFLFSPVVVNQKIKDYLSSDIPSDIREQASRVWRVSMLSSSADMPRALSVNLIKSNNLNTSGPDLRSADGYDKLKSEFDQWLSGWRYNNSQLKVRVLFARLISMSPDSGLTQLLKKNISLSVDEVSKLQLDHMEASKPDPAHIEKYFDHEDRESFVHGLGNMMPLPAVENIQKSNKPMKDSFEYYERAGVGRGHHLYDAARIFFEEYNNEGVPTEEFFLKRKEHLKRLFNLAVEASI